MAGMHRRLLVVFLALVFTFSTGASGITRASGTYLRHDQVSILSFPTGIALADSTIYVADSGHFRIVRFSLSGKILGQWGSPGSGQGQFGPSGEVNPGSRTALGPTSLAVDRSGNVYVADTGNQRIEKFSPGGGFEAAWPINPAVYLVREMAVAAGSRGNLIVAITGSSDCPDRCAAYYILERLSSSGTVLGQWTSPRLSPSPASYVISHLAVTSSHSGEVFVAVTGAAACSKACPGVAYVERWSPRGRVLGRWSTEGSVPSWRPLALASGLGASLYVANSDRSTIERWSYAGELIGQWGGKGRGPGQFEQPGGLAVDRRGSVWVADSGNDRIQRVSASGRVTVPWPH